MKRELSVSICQYLSKGDIMPRKKPRLRATIDVTLKNDFHRTQYTLRTRLYKPLTPGQIKGCRKILCGVPGCSCAGDLGIRGPQLFDVIEGFDVTGTTVITIEPLRGTLPQLRRV